ncbi:MAG TPA: DUF4097 family beta strand repeat-containing protein [Thermoanaerobaculia bacterium]|jgi:hypothetical protein
MNRFNRALYLLPIAMLLAAACGRSEHRPGTHGDHAKATITRSWPAAGVRALRVFEIDGSVKIEAADTDEISLVATAVGDFALDKKKQNDGLFETTLEGDTLKIGRREPNVKGFRIPFVFSRSDKRINYALRVPPTVSLEVKTVNGRIATRGIDAATDVTSVNGAIDVETGGTSELQASTVNGRVRAKFLRSFQGARFRTVNGGVEATLPQSASFNVDLSQVNGDFEASFPLSIHSNPGSRRVSGEVNGGEFELKITTVNGDIQLARLNGAL